MRPLSLSSLALLSLGVRALVTLESVRNLTALTDECRGRVERGEEEEGVGHGRRGVKGRERERERGGEGQVVLGAAGRDDRERGEVEESVTASLTLLCSTLLHDLSQPQPRPLQHSSSLPTPPTIDTEATPCPLIRDDFHAFLNATVRFVHAVQEEQMRWAWDGGSGVYAGVAWLQGLWASRRMNSQDRSFIEQQMTLYASTGCFGKSQEVLRRGVEVVEYLNDLMDEFN